MQKRNRIDKIKLIDMKPRKFKYKEKIEKDLSEHSESEDSSEVREDDEEGPTDHDGPNLYPDLTFMSSHGSTSSHRSPSSLLDRSDQSLYSRKCKLMQKPDHMIKPLECKIYKKSTKSWTNLFVILILIMAGSIFYLFSNFKEMENGTKKIRTLEEIYEVIQPDLITLKEKYPQTKQLWTQVLWQIKQITSYSPEQPSTLFFVIPKDAADIANCFIKKICLAVANGFQDDKSGIFDASKYTHFDPDDFKYELDQSLGGLNKFHCIALQHIEDAIPKAVMLLHGYCDNENAIFKRALIILTMQSNMTYEAKSLPQIFSIIEEKLTIMWRKHMRTDDIAALISRIATSPVLFKPEGLMC